MADRATAGLFDRIGRLCRTPENDRQLRVGILAEIRRAVGFDAYAWLLTDPETEVGVSPLADVPRLDELPGLIRAKYLTTVNRWTRMSRPVERLREATDDHREHSLVWRTFQRPSGVGDVASLVTRDEYGCWSFLDLWRMGDDARFTEVEADQLGRLVPVITSGLRASLVPTFNPVASTVESGGPVVLVLAPDLRVRTQTTETERYLEMLLPPHAGQRAIPAAAYNVAAQLLALEAGIDPHPASTRVHIPTRGWFTLRAARLGRPSNTEADIAVTVEPTPAPDRLSLFALATGLSPRERSVLEVLATGASTRQLADRLYLSEHTIQDHLKSIFDKTGCRSRPTLLANALGGGG